MFSGTKVAERPHSTDKGNIFLEGIKPRVAGKKTEDIENNVSAELANGRFITSRLAWADFIRNIMVFTDIEDIEPSIVLELGCGNFHNVGRMIAQAQVDTHYIGIDSNWDRASAVCDEEGRRQFAGVFHDLGKGIPLKDDSVDYVICLEAMEHFVDHSEDALKKFFGEIHRTLVSHGRFVLATPNPGDGPIVHPRCHEHEFDAKEVVDSANESGLRVKQCWNYRAKGPILDQAHEEWGGAEALPHGLIETLKLPELTFNAPIRGNVIYVMEQSK